MKKLSESIYMDIIYLHKQTFFNKNLHNPTLISIYGDSNKI